MRTETVYAATIEEAEAMAPWADFYADVESDKDGVKAWTFFESCDDYYNFLNQR